MPLFSLPDRSVITIHGADATGFLHGLVTTDVDGLEPGVAEAGALLTPQGKILFDFVLFRTGEGLSIDVATSEAEALAKRLTLYKLRAAVTLSLPEPTPVVLGEDVPAPQGAVTDGRFRRAGVTLWRAYGSSAEAIEDHASIIEDGEALDALHIKAGIARAGRDYALSDAFPHDVLLDRNGGLSFRKGCYVGQEVVSRMQHRSTARRRVVIVSGEAPLPDTGTPVTAGGKPLGTLGTVAGQSALAILRIDKVAEAVADGLPVLAGDVPVTVSLPAWTGLSFPAPDSAGTDAS
ncbi:hypothetical protein SAMN05880582_10134 [Rhizobium sp. RU20A]|uniref:CAF17-like 4Fe-4S cluster assembly/insertion protein YgfZ n=1 Tax=Rhizobium sp. RU20A TaxID=1907412 RepID=UPI000954BF48|nr:folate-binding protein YgfZ [Rhizobium sp. RU20A]SIP92372.1 hypothetical protein SAMN05880582_10134 [Rhizobium sp. RU20A]